MRTVFLAFLVGLTAGGLLAGFIINRTHHKEMDEMRTEIAKINADGAANKMLAASLKEQSEEERELRNRIISDLSKQQDEQKERFSLLDKSLKRKDEQIASLKKELEQKSAPAVTGKSDAAKEPEEKPAKDPREDMRSKMAEALRIGEQLRPEVAKELGLEGVDLDRFNAILSEESLRMKEAMEKFLLDSNAEVPPDWDDKDVTGALMHTVAQVMKDGGPPQFSKEDMDAMQKGEKTLTDILKPDHPMLLMGKALHEARTKTYEDAATMLDGESMKKLKDKYLPSGDFYFKGNLQIGFGKADWSKVGKDKAGASEEPR